MLPFVRRCAGPALLTLVLGSGCGAAPTEADAQDGPVGTAQSDIHIVPRWPDLIVYGETLPGGIGGYVVANQGLGGAGPFRLAVLAGSASFSVNFAGLAAGASVPFLLSSSNFSCDQGIDFIVDVDNTVAESNENNNTAAYRFPCEYQCAVCYQSGCTCGYDTPYYLCASHGGANPNLGCQQEP